MVLQEDMLAELKPSIHRIIKKQLGFSEETLLSESLTSLQHGADKDELTRKFFHFFPQIKCDDFDYTVPWSFFVSPDLFHQFLNLCYFWI